MKLSKFLYIWFILCAGTNYTYAQKHKDSTTIALGGWAGNSVNTVIFRKNSLVTYKGYQYAAYYDSTQHVVLARRPSGGKIWEVRQTVYSGDATDAHKSISIMVDGDGYLHMAWGQHNNQLNYVRSLAPASLALSPRLTMVGSKENKLSYPEFYKLPGGDLLFFYRDGGSGNGNLVLNRYSIKTKQWTRLQDNLIDGEGQRSAYWQLTVDAAGTIHLSWVWRETPDVATNHDMAYACSKDGGKTWQRSTGELYRLPINAANAEYACKIPQNSELINQTSMFADAAGHPFIATYWKDKGQSAPQYHIIYKTGAKWQVNSLSFRKTDFSLSGTGTKQVPISRPQLVAWPNGRFMAAALIFRDEELGNRVSLAVNNNINSNVWKIERLNNATVGSWEPTYDTELWKDRHVLDIFVEHVTQVDGEGRASTSPQPVQVLEWRPLNK